MGCDGGSIPKRHELNSQVDAKWACCSLSKVLQKPVVGCRLGKLYNKEKVIEFLLDRKAFGEGEAVAGHITRASDVITLNLTPNPALNQVETVSAIQGTTVSEKTRHAPWVCPITQKEMTGKNRFIFSSNCGCVISEQAIKEIPSELCLICSKPFTQDDIIPIHSEIPEELERLTKLVKAIASDRVAVDAAKKAAKSVKKAAKASEGGDIGVVEGTRKRKSPSEKEHRAAAKKVAIEAANEPARATSNINILMPKLDGGGLSDRTKSEAIRSLYLKDSTLPKGNYLTMGTFTRYVN
ncbi:Rtf2 RING-finger-domain-containing protein [Chytridium lagenaria]|nr:Rtf2 RING-finger-domain-containing protein [Chytridium lagenaria]